MKIKKITMGSLTTLATIAIPVATVASCGNE
ncbi:Vmc-like lipoprotein signal peptide domain-containing protein, partial [Mycoplasma marinum]